MDISREKRSETVTLRDAGAWWFVYIFFGVYLVGVVLDYLWNYLVLMLSLRQLHFKVSTRRKLVYCLIITGLGLLIDYLYYEFTWGYLVLGSLRVPPVFPRPGVQPVLEFATILVPMAILALVHFAISRPFLRMNSKQATVLGLAMGFFTAPWLIVGYVLLVP